VSDDIGLIRRHVGSAAGGIAAILLWGLLNLLGPSHAALIARLLLQLGGAAATILLWRRLEEPGETLRWTMAFFIGFSLVGAAQVATLALQWW
jgi:hypothetical protein